MVKRIFVTLLFSLLLLTCSDNSSGSNNFGQGVIKIGYISEAGKNYALSRLSSYAGNTALLQANNITDFTITQITSDVNPAELSKYNIIYLAEDWGVTTVSTYDNILANADAFRNFIEDGGALYSDQPNAYDRAGGITIDFLPTPLTIFGSYTNEEITITDPIHYITSGIDSVDMPLTGDQVKDLPDAYTVLAKGSKTGYPALFVQEYGEGKILFCMGSANRTSVHPFSDEVHLRMLSWLVQ